jgi:hypothetical protein
VKAIRSSPPSSDPASPGTAGFDVLFIDRSDGKVEECERVLDGTHIAPPAQQTASPSTPLMPTTDQPASPGNQPPEWTEQQLRYQVLRAVYDRSGGRCEKPASGSAIGADLNLRYEDLFRVVGYLERAGYLVKPEAGPTVCITPKGQTYIAAEAGRRRSIRE